MSAIGDRAAARLALNALALELPEAVYRDVREIFTTLLTEFDRLAEIERKLRDLLTTATRSTDVLDEIQVILKS